MLGRDAVFKVSAKEANIDPPEGGDCTGCCFGSAHDAGLNAAFGDGPVRTTRYGVDLDVFDLLANLTDHLLVDMSSL